MFHLVDNFQNTTGDALAGYRVRLKAASGVYATLYSDSSGTPIVSVSGVADAMVTDSAGQFECYVASGNYDLEFYDESEGFLKRVSDVPCLVQGSLTNNDGVTVAVPTGNSYASPRTGITVTGAAGATDVGASYHLTNGSMSAIDIQSSGTGYNMRFKRADGLLEAYMGSGNQFVTAKWIDIAAGIYTDNIATVGSVTHPAYARTYWPATQRPSMLSVHADVQTAVQIRPYNGADPIVMSAIDNAGYEQWQLTPTTFRFARADLPVYVGDIRDVTPVTTATTANCPLSMKSFNAGGLYGIQLKSDDVGTIGEAWLGLNSNGGLAGAVTGRTVVQYESASKIRLGNTTDATALAGAQLECEAPIRLKQYTVAGLPSAAAHVAGMVLVTNETGGAVVAFSDGTNWRRVTDRAVVS